MDIHETVLDQLRDSGRDADRRRELWEGLCEAFNDAGPDGVSEQIKRIWRQKVERLSELVSEIQALM